MLSAGRLGQPWAGDLVRDDYRGGKTPILTWLLQVPHACWGRSDALTKSTLPQHPAITSLAISTFPILQIPIASDSQLWLDGDFAPRRAVQSLAVNCFLMFKTLASAPQKIPLLPIRLKGALFFCKHRWTLPLIWLLETSHETHLFSDMYRFVRMTTSHSDFFQLGLCNSELRIIA